MSELIYGKNNIERIVSIEDCGDGTAELFIETETAVDTVKVPNLYYILFTDQHSPKFKRLNGDQPYRWLYETDSREKYSEVLSASYKKRYDMHVVRDPKEAIMLREGYTYFKGMKVQDVSVLSFDIETTGLTHDENSKVLLISNTYRKNGKVTRKLFSLDEYKSQWDMLTAWCQWVVEVNPSIVLGHNIFSFDLPYIKYVASRCNCDLLLGRDGSAIRFAERTSLFRKDGSQAYDYTNAWIYGREIVDTYFLAIKSDIARNYESYGLKQIIKQEGLERPGREHYDASQIAKNWHLPEERKKIKAYAIDDADDALKLYDLFIPSLFYYTQSIPRSFQQIINSATGSQINSLMVRAYLQKGHSIAKGSEAVEFEGAISFGVPGVHKNVLRFDVASLYPSVMLQYKVYPKNKDPHSLFLKILEYFTTERLKNKKLAKETGDRYYKDLEQSQKIVINSGYGFMGAPKLNYNYPEGASEVTRHGRRILKQAIKFITGKDYEPAA
jgi:DNA polymerase I